MHLFVFYNGFCWHHSRIMNEQIASRYELAIFLWFSWKDIRSFECLCMIKCFLMSLLDSIFNFLLFLTSLQISVWKLNVGSVVRKREWRYRPCYCTVSIRRKSKREEVNWWVIHQAGQYLPTFTRYYFFFFSLSVSKRYRISGENWE